MATDTRGTIQVTGSATVEDLQQKYAELEKNRAARRAQAREEGLQALGTVITSNEAIRTLRLRGYTPSFNDGDPCVHRQRDLVINGHDDDYEEEGPLPPVDRGTARPLTQLIGRMQKTFEEGFGTNWELNVTKNDDDSISWSSDDWDPGY